MKQTRWTIVDQYYYNLQVLPFEPVGKKLYQLLFPERSLIFYNRVIDGSVKQKC